MFTLVKRIIVFLIGLSMVSTSIAMASEVPSLRIGLSDQEAANFVLTESTAGALTDGGNLVLELPKGVFFAGTPYIEVVKGDIDITNVKTTQSDQVVIVDIEGESTTPSSIQVSEVRLKLDRTVPQGDITLKVKGTAVDEVSGGVADWANSDTAATLIIGKVVTPASMEESITAKFIIGSNTYMVNDVEKSIDTAPYVKEGHTYLPVRFFAEALGISGNNVIWDPSTMTLTLMKKDRLVQIRLGEQMLNVNGVSFTINAEMKQGRVMLPMRDLAQAFGVEISWDEKTQTVTIM